MSITRRQVLKGAVGAAGAIAVGGLSKYLFSEYLGDNYREAQIGGIPLIHANSSLQFNPTISLVGAAGYFNAAAVKHNIQNYYKVLFFDPSGKLLFNKEYILNSFDHQLVSFDDLGWGSAIVAVAAPGASEQLPQIDVVSTFTHETAAGEDGHHLQSIRDTNKHSCHVILSPNLDEERLVGCFNPSPNRISGAIALHDESGQVVFSEDVEWGPFQTKYLALGNSVVKPPGALHFESYGRKPLLVSLKGEGTGIVLTSSWHYREKTNPYFTQAHGANFILYKNSGLDEKESATIEELKKATHLTDLYQRSDIFPGDFCNHSEKKWNMKVTIPNVTLHPVPAGVFITDSLGNIVANSFASVGPVKIKPNSLTQIDLKPLLTHVDPKGVYALNCYVGANLYSSYSLTKPVIIDENDRLMFQHLRPHDLDMKGEALTQYLKSTNYHVTDYWIGNIDLKSVTEIVGLVRNNGTMDETKGQVMIFNNDQLVSRMPLPKVPKNGFLLQKISVTEDHKDKVGIRVIGPAGNLTISLLFKHRLGNYSIRHGSAKSNRYPNIAALRKTIRV